VHLDTIKAIHLPTDTLSYLSYKPLKFALKLKLKLLLHVSVYDHNQGVYTWT